MTQTATLQTNQTKPITYDVDKITFHVTPIYKDGKSKSVHDIILNLMKKESQ